MSEAEVRRMRTAYYGMISEVDDHLGRVIGYLKETGQYDKTLIVFTCDHGEQLGDHHLLGKIGYGTRVSIFRWSFATRRQKPPAAADVSWINSPRLSMSCPPSSHG